MNIKNIYSDDSVKHISLESNSKFQFEKSLKLLKIIPENFTRIHTLSLRSKHLKDLWLQAEVEVIRSNLQYSQNESYLHQLKIAYQTLLTSSLMTENLDQYSPFSIGLQEIDTDSQTKEEQSPDQTIIYQGPKKKGVEPGFEAIKKNDILEEVFIRYPQAQERWQYIVKHKADYQLLNQALWMSLPTYMVKSDYHKIDNGIVEPDKEDLMRSHTIQNIYSKNHVAGNFVTYVYGKIKKQHFAEINKRAVREVLGNDIIRAYGVEAQEQHLMFDHYIDGHTKIKLKSKMIKGATTLGPLYGSNDCKSYRAREVLNSFNGIKYLADDRIKNLSEKLPPFVVLGDRDTVGGEGDNKLCLDNELVCIDTGHAFEDYIINYITENFSVTAPKFKNFTIFFGLRSQIMRGIIKLAKVADYSLSEKILKSYGSQFYNSIAQIEKNVDVKILDDYLKKFNELRKEYIKDNSNSGNDNLKCCNEILIDLEKIKKDVIDWRNELIKKFDKYLVLEEREIDLIENIEKLLTGKTNTSLRSPDKTTLLHHLRIVDESKINWHVEISQDQNEACKFSLKFNSDKSLMEASKVLENWLSKEEKTFYSLDEKNRKLDFSIDRKKIFEISNLFNEDKIKKTFHHNDYFAYLYYLSEKELQESLDQLKVHFQPKIEIHSGSKYKITLKSSVQEVDPEIVDLFKKYFGETFSSDNFFIEAKISEMREASKKISTILFEYERNKSTKRELLNLETILKELNTYEQDLISTIESNKERTVFKICFSTEKCSDIFNGTFSKFSSRFKSEFSYHDLPQVRVVIRGMIDEYLKNLEGVNQLLAEFDNNNLVLSKCLGFDQPLLELKSKATDTFFLSISEKTPKHFLNLFGRLIAKDLSNENILIFKAKDIESLNEAIHKMYNHYIKENINKKEVLNQIIKVINADIKNVFNFEEETTLTVNQTEEFNYHLNFITSENLGEIESVLKVYSEVSSKDVGSVLNVCDQIDLLLQNYKNKLVAVKNILEKIKLILNLETDMACLTICRGVIYFNIIKFTEFDEINNELELVAKNFNQNQQLGLSKRLDTLEVACEKFLIKLNMFFVEKENSLKAIIKDVFSEIELYKDVSLNITNINSQLFFTVTIDDPSLKEMLKKHFIFYEAKNKFLLPDENKFEEKLKLIVSHYKQDLAYKDLEGFELLDFDDNAETSLPALMATLKRLSDELEAIIKQTTSQTYLSQSISNLYNIFLKAPNYSSTGFIKTTENFKKTIDEFIACNDFENISVLKVTLEGRSNYIYESASSELEILSEAIVQCRKLLKNKNLFKGNEYS